MGFEPTCTALQAAASPLGHSTRDSNPTSPKTYPSGRRDSNPRPSPWQGDALPLSHVRTAEPRPDLSGVFRRVTDSSRKMGQESKSPQVSALFRRARAASSVVVDGSACGSPRSDRVRDAGGRRGRRPVAPSCLPGPRTAATGQGRTDRVRRGTGGRSWCTRAGRSRTRTPGLPGAAWRRAGWRTGSGVLERV